MSLRTFFLRRAAKLPKGRFRVQSDRSLRLPMRDGVELATQLYTPLGTGPFPTIMLRVPYGLRAFSIAGEAFAERGFITVVQACRGTDASGGEFDPLSNERNDGLDTLAWIKAQPWFDGRLGTTGASYLGYCEWAISDSLPKHSAMAVRVSSAEFKSVSFPGGAFHLGLWLGWIQIIYGLKRRPFRFARRMASGGVERQTEKAAMKLPLSDVDRRLTGEKNTFWSHWLENAVANDEHWREIDHTHRLGLRTPPTSFISGWFDIMVDQLLRDYESLADAGGKPYLTVGPWWHVSEEIQFESIRDTLNWMNAQLNGDRSGLREKPVRLHIGGTNQWREFDAYPPGPPDTQIWHLHPDKVLSQRPVKASPPDSYTYDPRKPTPNVGGATFAFTGAGPISQAPLENRNDVLVYTSEPLWADVTIIGNVRATIYARSSLTNADLFVKLCDVDEKGVSINICDGIVRKTSADPAEPDDIWKLTLKLHATAHCFKRDHRLRLIVASGAHPRYARNTGTDEPFGSATTLVPMQMEIFHDPARPSTVQLPAYEL